MSKCVFSKTINDFAKTKIVLNLSTYYNCIFVIEHFFGWITGFLSGSDTDRIDRHQLFKILLPKASSQVEY